MKFREKYIALLVILILGMMFLKGYRPIYNFLHQSGASPVGHFVQSILPPYDSGKKTVMIVADPKLTELFDMLTPFYLFNATGRANVYIVSKVKSPILIRKDLFVSPQLTFKEADSMKLLPDLIVIPALSARDEHQDTSVIDWIRKHFAPQTKMMTICDGASTGAATGLYDGKLLTCHATDIKGIMSHFSKPKWVKDICVTKDGNLYSTAGVSNAVEGSLFLMKELFGTETAQKMAAEINYPHKDIKLDHQSIALNGRNMLSAFMKVFFSRNRNVGVLLENGIDEFTMAGILDTYSRTFPSSLKTYIVKGKSILTKYGLAVTCTSDNEVKDLDELHVITPETFSKENEAYFKNIKTIRYRNGEGEYLIDAYLKEISNEYNEPFQKFVRVSLDYN